MTLTGHTGHIECVGFSPDGHTIASASADTSIRLWDSSTGGQRCKLEGHSEIVRSVSFSPDGRTLASGSDDNTIRIWDVATGKEIKRIASKSGSVRSVCFSPKSNFIAAGGDDSAVRLWNASSGKEIHTLIGHSRKVDSVSFSPDGQTLASASHDKTIRIWNVLTGREMRVLTGHFSAVSSVCFSVESNTLISGSLDDTIRVWAVDKGAEIRKLSPKQSYISSVCVSPGGRMFASGSYDGSICVYDNATTRQVKRIIGLGSWVNSVGISRDGNLLYNGSDDRKLHIWSSDSSRQHQELAGHLNRVVSVNLSSNGKSLVSGSWDQTVRIWATDLGGQVRKLEGHLESVNGVCFSPDDRLIASGSNDKSVRIWDANTGHCLHQLVGHFGAVYSVCFSPDGKLIASAGADATCRLWNVATGRELCRLMAETSVVSLSFAPNGRTLAGASANGIRLWDVSKRTVLRNIAGNSGTVNSVCFSNDGRMIAGADSNNSVVLWDVSDGREVGEFKGHSALVSSVCFSPDSRTLFSGSFDGTARLWDVTFKRELCSLISFSDGTWAVTDPDGRYDGSNLGQVTDLHWVYDDLKNRRMEPIELGQFASFYYTPGLLAKIWARQPLPEVPKLSDIALYPEISKLSIENSRVQARLHDRGGGFGDVHIVVNGIDVKTVPGAAKVDVDLGEKLNGLHNPDVRIYAYNAQKTIHSRATAVNEMPEPIKPPIKPKFVAVVGSVRHYANPALDLTFTDADALSVTKALIAMAKGLLAELDIELVCEDPAAKLLASSTVHVHEANKSGFESAFEAAVKRADADTAIMVYLSGHGAAVASDGGRKNEYYFLTRDAKDGASSSLAIPEVAKVYALSGEEIRGYLSKALNCRRRFVVLDTCAAGASKDQLFALRGDLEDQARARKEFQQGTGTYALMGAADGKASLEAAEFGHGLLTYALLSALKNRKLGDEKAPDMVLASQLIKATNSLTRELADRIGRGQTPMAIAPDDGILVLGLMDSAARSSIFLPESLPILTRPLLVNVTTGDATVANEVANLLRESAVGNRDTAGTNVFASYVEDSPTALRLQGTYSESNGVITVQASFFRNGKSESKPFPKISGKPDEIAKKILLAIKEWLTSSNRATGKVLAAKDIKSKDDRRETGNSS